MRLDKTITNGFIDMGQVNGIISQRVTENANETDWDEDNKSAEDKSFEKGRSSELAGNRNEHDHDAKSEYLDKDYVQLSPAGAKNSRNLFN